MLDRAIPNRASKEAVHDAREPLPDGRGSGQDGGPRHASTVMTERVWRLGAVSYLNTKPLIEGLAEDPSVELVFDVPAKLPALLASRAVDAALVPMIDLLAEGRDWRIVSDACIGCDGETLTVRVFSRVPAPSIRTLYVDGDSHTSVALARIIWKERHGRKLDILPFTGSETVGECEAVLLIGDKVINHKLIGYDIQTDLGQAWKSLTSLPFVFAAWAAPRDLDVTGLAERLSAARDAGVKAAAMIAADVGPGLGWPVELAKRYLTSRLKFTLSPRHRLGMERFLELAKANDLVRPDRELVFA